VSSGDVGPDQWLSQGLCGDEDPELFFPDGEKGAVAREQIAQAKAVCAVCPVLAQCREWELTPTREGKLRNEFGVFAGLSAGERQAALRHGYRAGAEVAA
jgi:WhiB family redox-sensing transcriptional regulator